MRQQIRNLSDFEKRELIREHGEVLARAFQGIGGVYREDLIEHAQRAIELIKSLPASEFAPR